MKKIILIGTSIISIILLCTIIMQKKKQFNKESYLKIDEEEEFLTDYLENLYYQNDERKCYKRWTM